MACNLGQVAGGGGGGGYREMVLLQLSVREK